MFDPAATALLRAVLDDVCETIFRAEAGTPTHVDCTRTHVASRILEAVARGDTSPDHLKQAGREALSDAPTMWR
jgi:hypothetical protein